jgi:hypothetical protein
MPSSGTAASTIGSARRARFTRSSPAATRTSSACASASDGGLCPDHDCSAYVRTGASVRATFGCDRPRCATNESSCTETRLCRAMCGHLALGPPEPDRGLRNPATKDGRHHGPRDDRVVARHRVVRGGRDELCGQIQQPRLQRAPLRSAIAKRDEQRCPSGASNASQLSLPVRLPVSQCNRPVSKDRDGPRRSDSRAVTRGESTLAGVAPDQSQRRDLRLCRRHQPWRRKVRSAILVQQVRHRASVLRSSVEIGAAPPPARQRVCRWRAREDPPSRWHVAQ